MKRFLIRQNLNGYRVAGAVGLGLLALSATGGPLALPVAADDKDSGPVAGVNDKTTEKGLGLREVAVKRDDPKVEPEATLPDEGEPLAPPLQAPQIGNERDPGGNPTANAQLSTAKQREDNLRRLMSSLGCNVPEVQDAIVDYIVQDTGARQPLRDSTGRLFIAMRTPNLPDSQISVYLKDCRIALEGDKTRRANAEAALRNTIGYQMTPRLEAMMLLFGLQGDMAFSAPNPKLISQLEQKNKQLKRDADGLKIEVESLRRERDTARTERDTCRQGQMQAAPAQATPAQAPAANANAYDAPPVTNKNVQDNGTLKRDNERLLKENESLRRELEAVRQANKK